MSATYATFRLGRQLAAELDARRDDCSRAVQARWVSITRCSTTWEYKNYRAPERPITTRYYTEDAADSTNHIMAPLGYDLPQFHGFRQGVRCLVTADHPLW
jgi:hypothetical protein